MCGIKACGEYSEEARRSRKPLALARGSSLS